MRRRALLSGLLVGALAVLSSAFTVTPLLDVPLEPDDGEGEEEQPPPSIEPPAEPPPLGPQEEEEEEAPPTEPA
jgi:hypothetical protein